METESWRNVYKGKGGGAIVLPMTQFIDMFLMGTARNTVVALRIKARASDCKSEADKSARLCKEA